MRGSTFAFHLLLCAAAGVLCGCSGGSTTSTTTTTTTTTTSSGAIDPTAIPLGDGKVSSTTPAVGYVYSCISTFPSTGGASVVGPWINTSAGTWNSTTKVAVEGSVAWPANAATFTLSGSNRLIASNGLPNHNTGTFPIATSDPAHQYDGNPNHIAAQTISYTLPASPTAAASPTCLGLGPIGIMLTGSLFFNALDAEGRDAGAHEEQDSCQGHPDGSDEYHYHSRPTCVSDPGTGHSALLGYALDGFGIFGPRDDSGTAVTNADLDACHGHTESITWDGKTVSMYHYHTTTEYPYTVGCFKGTPVK